MISNLVFEGQYLKLGHLWDINFLTNIVGQRLLDALHIIAKQRESSELWINFSIL